MDFYVLPDTAIDAEFIFHFTHLSGLGTARLFLGEIQDYLGNSIQINVSGLKKIIQPCMCTVMDCHPFEMKSWK